MRQTRWDTQFADFRTRFDALAKLAGTNDTPVTHAIAGLRAAMEQLSTATQELLAHPDQQQAMPQALPGKPPTVTAPIKKYSPTYQDMTGSNLETLRKTEERLRLALDAADLGTWDLDLATGCVARSLRYDQIFGYQELQPEWSLETALQHVLAEDRPLFRESHSRANRTGALSIEVRVLHPDGSLHWIHVRGRFHLDRQGRAVRVLGVIADITERKQAEEALGKHAAEALRLSEQEFHSLAEAMPQMVWATRPDGWNIYFNQQWVDYTGMTLEESYGHGWNIPFHPDDKQRAWEAWQRATRHNERYSLECRLRRADGVYRWWLIRGVPMLGAHGEILKWFGTCTDIEELKNAEAALQEANARLEQRVAERTAALQESEERFRLALQNAPVSVALQDRNMVYQWAYNQRARRPEEIIGKTDAELFAPEEAAEILQAKRRVLNTGQPVHVQRWLTANDRRMFLDIHYEPTRDAAGAIRGIGIAVVDLTEQKLAEEALRKSEQRQRLLAETMLQGVVHQDAAGTIIAMNPAAERILGKTREEFLGSSSTREERQTLRENGTPFPGVEHPAMVALRTGEPVRGVVMGVFNPQRQAHRWIRIDAVPVLRPGESRAAEVYTVFEDITERRQAEEQLRRTHERLGLLLKALPVGVHIAEDAQCRVITSNPAAARMFEAVPAANISASADSPPRNRFFHHGRELKAEELPMQVALREKREVRDVELELHLPSGRRWTALVSATPLREHDGTVIGGIAVILDITERKRAEEAVHASEEKYRRIVDTALEGIWVLDFEGRITFVNQAMARMLGYAVDEMMGRPLFDFMDQAGRQVAERHLQRRGEGLSEQHDFRFRRKDGSALWTLVNTAPMVDDQDRMLGVLGMITDITARKHVEESLEQAKAQAEAANQTKDQFLAVLSHELRTPLSPALMLVTAQENNPELPDPVRRDLATVRHNVELEVRIIDDLLDLARVTSGKMQLHRQQVSVQDVLRQAIGTCAADITARDLRLHQAFAASQDLVQADPARLQQVFWNLLKNAVKFTPEGGSLWVSCRTTSTARVQVQVKDTGVGIAPEALPRIFEAFEQADKSITRQFGGLGLGLAISKTIVALHGGTIQAVSQGQGQGATFTVELPLAEAVPAGAPVVSPPATAAPAHSFRLLLVEDHVDTARTLARLLRASGHQVQTAGSVAAALEQLTRERFDLLLSDLGLPDATGYELMALVRARYGIPGVCMSGFGMEADIAKARAAGFAVHLTKPISVAQLEQTIQAVLATPPSGH